MDKTMENYMEKAQKTFHQPPENYNCSQAVAALVGETEVAQTLQPFGGGRAAGGICGALYSALLLTPEDRHEEVKKEFAELVGDLTCREIKSKAKTSCQKCVAAGTMLAEKYRKQS